MTSVNDHGLCRDMLVRSAVPTLFGLTCIFISNNILRTILEGVVDKYDRKEKKKKVQTIKKAEKFKMLPAN